MLCELHIQNYAIIYSLDLNFQKDFTVFTGETGAGKSIIIGALSFLLGDKFSPNLVFDENKKLFVEAVFSITNPFILSQLENLGIEDPSNLIIRREITENQKSRCFLNGYQVPIGKLQEISPFLVDLHGQHDHQMLFSQKYHLDILDTYLDLIEERKEFFQLQKEFLEFQNTKKELLKEQKEHEQNIEFWNMAYLEISEAHFSSDEEDSLKKKLDIAEKKDKLYQNLSQSYQLLAENDSNVISTLGLIKKLLKENAILDTDYEESLKICEEINSKNEQLSSFLNTKLENLEDNTLNIDDIIARMDLLSKLKLKYKKNTLEDLLSYEKECKMRLDSFEKDDTKLKKIQEKIKSLLTLLVEKGTYLSKKRVEGAKKFKKEIENHLSFLEMGYAKFEVEDHFVKDPSSELSWKNEPIMIFPYGFDHIEFLISTNTQKKSYPLKKIASGGEISRIMLAIKSVLSQKDIIETLVFDEIDTGVGGLTANYVAEEMKKIAQNKQLFTITHLPQIAAKATFHYRVYKEKNGDTSSTHVKLLDKQERIKEIARMQGKEGETSDKLAKEILGF